MPLTITSPTPWQVAQRSGSTAVLSISGTSYSGSGPIQCRWLPAGERWHTLDATPADGAFSGTLEVPVIADNAVGTLEVRRANQPEDTAAVASVCVGDVIMVLGQSNAMGSLDNHQTVPPDGRAPATMFGNNYQYRVLVDPLDSDAGQVDQISRDINITTGSIWPLVAGAIVEHTGVAVCFVPCAKGGSSISQWAPSTDRATLCGSAMHRAGVVGAGLAVWWQGEADGLSGTTQASYVASLKAIAALFYNTHGVPIVPAVLQNCTGIGSSALAVIQDAQRECQQSGLPSLKEGPDLSDISTDDGLHVKIDIKAAQAAALWAAALTPLLPPAGDAAPGFPAVSLFPLALNL